MAYQIPDTGFILFTKISLMTVAAAIDACKSVAAWKQAQGVETTPQQFLTLLAKQPIFGDSPQAPVRAQPKKNKLPTNEERFDEMMKHTIEHLVRPGDKIKCKYFQVY